MNTRASSQNPDASRRRFLAQVALTAAGGSIATQTLGALEPGETGETDHFFYRLADADAPWVDTQRGSRAFAFSEGRIHVSDDNSRTWKHSAAFEDARNIQFSSILEDDSIVFATQRRIFHASPDLTRVEERTVLDPGGGPYRIHPLRENEVPGWYFYSLDGIHTFDVNGVGEMLIWGNYCNVRTGPVPVNIYYSTDGGKTIRTAYRFGQNPAFQYKDTDPGDRTLWVGNPDNPAVCRHIHSVTYNPVENAFYACTGDIDRKIGVGLECHWLRGTYDPGEDAWDWRIVVSSDANSRYKCGGMNFHEGKIYWVADANGPKTIREVYDRGVFRCAPEDIPDKTKHEVLYPAEYEIAVMTMHGETMVIPEYGNANPCDCGFLFSPDLGKTWGKYDLKELGDRSGVRVNPPNEDGWYRVSLMKKWVEWGEVLWLKPKS